MTIYARFSSGETWYSPILMKNATIRTVGQLKLLKKRIKESIDTKDRKQALLII